ncbi:hypothetical protein C0Q70_05683 [Pomacea canaliculata]|uniref:Uncharacterized protein n=1 Tax=Pomacea canaliculata TaxID=400727 RepID=A0A2T7PLV8_POMCA|nr:hypothetical protein C0Q70_05683 [Pomacea canaliculata]
MAGNDVQDYRWTALRFGTSYSVNKEQSRKLSIDLNVFCETLMNDLCFQPCAPNSSLKRTEETQHQAHDEDCEASRKRGGIKGSQNSLTQTNDLQVVQRHWLRVTSSVTRGGVCVTGYYVLCIRLGSACCTCA